MGQETVDGFAAEWIEKHVRRWRKWFNRWAFGLGRAAGHAG
jgi:ABC-type proline/glycine betaine transport system substrate-binding protein